MLDFTNISCLNKCLNLFIQSSSLPSKLTAINSILAGRVVLGPRPHADGKPLTTTQHRFWPETGVSSPVLYYHIPPYYSNLFCTDWLLKNSVKNLVFLNFSQKEKNAGASCKINKTLYNMQPNYSITGPANTNSIRKEECSTIIL